MNEKTRVIVSGTSIQPSSRMTAGAIMMRAAERECWVAMGDSSSDRRHPSEDCNREKKGQGSRGAKALAEEE